MFKDWGVKQAVKSDFSVWQGIFNLVLKKKKKKNKKNKTKQKLIYFDF